MNAAAQFPDGFVTLEQAENLRQENEAAAFRARNPAEFDRLVAAIENYKAASLEFQAARVAAGNVTTSNMTDIVQAAEREVDRKRADVAKVGSVVDLARADSLKAKARPKR